MVQKNQLLFILSLLFAILVTIFAITNAKPVVTNLFFVSFEASLALIIFISAALGAIIVALLGFRSYFRFKSKIAKITKEKDVLSSRIHELEAALTELEQKVNTGELITEYEARNEDNNIK